MKKDKKLPGMFWVFIGFLPWIFSWTLSGTRGVATGLIAAAVLNAGRLRSRNFKVLEVVTLAYFATHLLFSMVLGSSFFSDYGRILSGIALASVAWGSLLAGSPFTYQYAREDWDEVYWDDPYFRLINQIITAVWGLVFTVRVVLEIAAVITVFSEGARLWLLTVLPHAGLVLAILFSSFFPNWFVRIGIKKYLANREPYKWPVPIFPESHASEPDRHDVIVIGSGIGGLTAASLLARRGRKVAVFEQHTLAGGYCTSWVRHVKQGDKKGRYVFDAGVHDVSGLGERGPVRNLLRQLDIEAGIHWHPMHHEYHLGGLHLKVPPDPEGFPRALTALFPHEQDGIADFFDEMHHVYHEMYADVGRTGGIPREPGTVEELLKYPETHPHFFQWQDIPFIRMLNRYFRDDRLKEFLSVLTGYLCDDPTSLTVGAMAPIFGYYFDGGYYPAGGSQSLADMLVNVIEDHGGQVRRHAPVRRIMVENGRATGVELADGERHKAEAIISNADVKKTFLELVGGEHLPEEFAQQMETLRPSTSAFVVSLGLDVVPGIAPMTVTDEIGIAAPSIADPTLAPPDHAAIQLVSFVSQDEVFSWDRHAPNYAQRKRERGDAMIAAAEKVIPDLRSHIIYRQDSSPCTFARYTWTTGGAIYGPAAGHTLPPLKTPIERLYLAGSGTTCGPGIEAVVITGTLVADAISPDPRTAIDTTNREPVTRRPSVALLFAALLFAGTTIFADDNTSDWMLVPFPIYSPETQLAITLTAMHTHRSPESKHPSSVMLSGAYSELNQISVSLTTERALMKSRLWFIGNLKYEDWPSDFYGIGHDTPKDARESFTARNWLGHVTLRYHLASHWAIGICGEFSDYTIHDTEENNALAAADIPGSTEARVAGIGASVVWDSRDDRFFSEHGSLAELSAMTFKESKNKTSFQRLRLDTRQFLSLGDWGVLAFIESVSVLIGDAPFQELSRIGDIRDVSLMRGYYSGRYLDRNTAVAQAEWRFPLSTRFGGVLFGSVGTIGDNLFNSEKSSTYIAGGGGLRYRIGDAEKVNVRLDIAAGAEEVGVYFAFLEAF